VFSIKRFLAKLWIVPLLFAVAPAWAFERYALLIANEKYPPEIGVLRFPSQDISVLEKSLVALGFKVTKVSNVGYKEFNKALREHINRVNATLPNAAEPPESFLYYAGHGASDSVTKTNYLIPVDVTDASADSLWDGSINLQQNVLEALKKLAPRAHHYVVIDACRNELKLRNKERALTVAGKAFVAPAPVTGMLIAYATDENQTTPDDGLYAKALAKALLVEEDDIVVVFRKVQMEIQNVARRFPYAIAIGLPQTYFARRYSMEPHENKPMVGPTSIFRQSNVESKIDALLCPEITIMDYSQYPPKSKVERRCLPGR
jgi:hypothetical protein